MRQPQAREATAFPASIPKSPCPTARLRPDLAAGACPHGQEPTRLPRPSENSVNDRDRAPSFFCDRTRETGTLPRMQPGRSWGEAWRPQVDPPLRLTLPRDVMQARMTHPGLPDPMMEYCSPN